MIRKKVDAIDDYQPASLDGATAIAHSGSRLDSVFDADRRELTGGTLGSGAVGALVNAWRLLLARLTQRGNCIK